MSLPSAVFLDTSILAGQQYNFSSAALSSFVPVARDRKLSLLLPDPTRREVVRQIEERSVEALRTLDRARRNAPFLSKWKGFPPLSSTRYGDWEVKFVATNEWNAFLKKFDVVALGYEAVKLDVIMEWYDRVQPPFQKGNKRKEFPDAFAIAALAAHAEKIGANVAVVSEDTDFGAACNRFPRLLYFSSLPALTELLLSTEGEVLERTRKLILADAELLKNAIKDQELFPYHEDERFEDIEDVEILDVSLEDFHIVGLGHRDCTIAFKAKVEVSARVSGADEETEELLQNTTHYLADEVILSGTIKLLLKEDRSGVAGVTFVKLDQSEVEIDKIPWDDW